MFQKEREYIKKQNAAFNKLKKKIEREDKKREKQERKRTGYVPPPVNHPHKSRFSAMNLFIGKKIFYKVYDIF